MVEIESRATDARYTRVIKEYYLMSATCNNSEETFETTTHGSKISEEEHIPESQPEAESSEPKSWDSP